MSKTYEIFSLEDIASLSDKLKVFAIDRQMKNLPFQKLTIIVKRYVKPKTSQQHKAYWSCISRLKSALKNECGVVMNEDELHEWIKRKAGFTRVIETPDGKTEMITKSISDASEDVNIENMNFLISFIQQWAAENIGVQIELDQNSCFFQRESL